MADNEQEINVEQEVDEPEFETPMDRFFFHQRRALEETGKALEALLPPDFRSHAGEASKEFAKGFHVLVDAAIDELKKSVNVKKRKRNRLFMMMKMMIMMNPLQPQGRQKSKLNLTNAN